MPHPLRVALWGLWLLLGVMVGPSMAAAAERVQVGGAHFPPYVGKFEEEKATGLLPELLTALNQIQGQYQFVLLPTAVARRFRDFQQGRIDIAIFENPEWGWQGIPHQLVDMGLEDAEVYVARNEPSRGQAYFDQLKGKRLALYNGYHYRFASFNADPEFLRREFNATLTYSHDSNLLMVLRGRADVALVTRSYLDDFLVRHPQYEGQLLMANTVDQVYHHYALLRPESPIDAKEFATLLDHLRRDGRLMRIFEPYRIQVMPVEGDSSVATDGKD